MASWTVFDKFLENLLDGGGINLDTGGDTIKCMLIDSTRAPVEATDEFIGPDINANEVSGTGYTAGGATLANQTVTLAAGTVTFDGDDITWSQNAAGFNNARYAVLYKDTGTPATSPVIAFCNFTTDQNNVDGDLTLEMDTDGILTVS